MGKVIKKGNVDSSEIATDPSLPVFTRRAPIIDRNTVEARSEAQEIRARAQAEIDSLLQEAKEQAESIKQRAHDEGYAEGRSQGASELTEIVAGASQRLNQIEAQIIPQIKDLALGIARKILGRELETHPDAIVDLIKQALAEKARQRREISLRINPEDLSLIRDSRSQLLEVLSRAKEISLREDPNVSRYGVVIETDAGTIDAQLETQLEVLERVLKEVH